MAERTPPSPPISSSRFNRLPAHWVSAQGQFYMGFTFCLALMSWVLGSLSPDAVDRQNAHVLSLIILALMLLYAVGLPLRWSLNAALAYAFFTWCANPFTAAACFQIRSTGWSCCP